MLQNRSWRATVITFATLMLLMAAAALAQPATAPTSNPSTGPAAAVIPADVRDVLDAVRQAYAQLDAVKLTGTITSDMDVAGQQQKVEKEFTGAFQAPIKFRHELDGGELVVGATGDKTFAHSKEGNSYILADPPKPDAPARDLPRPIPEILQSQNPSLLLALEKEPLKNLSAIGGNISKTDDVQLDGRAFTALRMTSADGAAITILIDPNTHLIRRITTDLKPALERSGAPDVKRAGFTIDYAETDTTPQFGTQHFAWSPPEGATDATAARDNVEQTSAQNLVGKPAPDFKLDRIDGGSVALSDLKGQVVLLDFWASWCPPCVESLPHLGKLYGQQNDGVKVLAINLREDKDQVQAFARAHNISIPILLDRGGDVAQKYNVSAIPQTVLIGPDGTVRDVFVGLGPDQQAQLTEAIERIKGAAADSTAVPAAAKE